MIQEKAVCFGEILWDRLPSGIKPGGAPMNVAYHLQRLGTPTSIISRVGKDDWGKQLISLLEGQGINTQYIEVDEQYSTGLVDAHLKENNEVEYDIVYPVAWDFISFNGSLLPLVEKTEYFVFGSLSARSSVSRKTLFQLLETANKKVFDINLRPPHFDKLVIEALLHRTNILKLNDNEIKLVSAWFNQYTAIADQLDYLMSQFKIGTILVTKGSAGAIVNHNGKIYEHSGLKVKVADTVGSGDAFLAAYLFKTNKGATPDQALLFANTLGAFIATQSGACPEYDVADVFELMKNEMP